MYALGMSVERQEATSGSWRPTWCGGSARRSRPTPAARRAVLKCEAVASQSPARLIKMGDWEPALLRPACPWVSWNIERPALPADGHLRALTMQG